MVDPTLADVIMRLKRRRGGTDELLAYKQGGRWPDIKSGDINLFLKEATDHDVSAKDFRTWSATVLAAVGLAVSGAAPRTPRRPASGPSTARSRRWRTTWATRRRSRAPRTSTRVSSTATTTAGSSTCRSWGRATTPTAIQGPLEQAVLGLLEGG